MNHAHLHSRLDRLGFWFSMICAVHCMVMPVILVFLPLFSLRRWSATVDQGVICVAAGIGLTSCLLSLRHHEKAAPLLTFLAGLLMAILARVSGGYLNDIFARTLLIGGPLLMAFALWKDWHLCSAKRSEGAPDHVHSPDCRGHEEHALPVEKSAPLAP